MYFNRINNIAGWVVCLIACTVYIMTTEAGGSFWDCGEFVSSCFKLQIPHPPGAPLFVLIGRIFIVLFGDNPLTAAKAVNIMSALASGFTILFLFWTITHYARKIVLGNNQGIALTTKQITTIVAAGAVGALAYTFSDSFWYSAVEGEVYALSSFFTAIVFWAILKWENRADEPRNDRWLVFIFFLVGLSIGVHLLCLLCIPAIVITWYFKKRPALNYPLLRKYFIRLTLIGGALATVLALAGAQGEVNPERGVPFDGTMAGIVFGGVALAIGLLYAVEKISGPKKAFYGGAYIFFAIGAIILGIVQVGIIQYSVKLAGHFDVFFVNQLGLPFFWGFACFFLLLGIGIYAGLRVAAKKSWPYLRLALWCMAFTLLGYSTYITTMLRSNADPAVDVFNVDNPESLEGYLGRAQYGDFPLLYGQKFNAQPVDFKDGPEVFEKGDKKYVEGERQGRYVFMPQDKMIFPRMWDMGNEQGHVDYYYYFMNVGRTKDGTPDLEKDETGLYTRPNVADNVTYLLGYQTNFMYLRYFFWNFCGKQNDIEGITPANVRDGNWITGIPVIDNDMYGNQSMLPDSIKHNKAHNSLFMLPFILGLIGLFYQIRKRVDDGLACFLLFFMTGFAIVIYLNQPGQQPRERDYAYVGSFYAFAIWIGLSVVYFVDLAANWNKKLTNYMAWCGGATAVLMLLVAIPTGGYITLGLGFAILFAALAIGLPAALKRIGNTYAILYGAALISLAVPIWMGMQEWDDHDRSKKQLARDTAKDFLESCAPNAILFTMADNDTYPLWYAQEVEGIRPDVRIVITTLLQSDWCINTLRYKINQSAPVDVIWSKEQIQGTKRDYIPFQQKAAYDPNKYYNLYNVMKNYVGNDANVDERGNNIFPTKKLSVPVDVAAVRANGTVNPEDSVVNELLLDIPKNNLLKNESAILNIIAANQWKRPIYFSMPYGALGFGNYLRKEGLAYRLVPVISSTINTNKMMDVVMNKFGYGNANVANVYFDEVNRQQLLTIRRANTELAIDLAGKNRKDEARKVLERADNMLLQSNFAYGMVSRGNEHNRESLMFLEACYRAEDMPLIKKVSASVKKDLQQQIVYYNGLPADKADGLQYEKNVAQTLLEELQKMQDAFTPKKLPAQ